MSPAVKNLFPWIFVFLWSSGFVGAKYIHPYAEPFTFLTIRYACAFIILVIAAWGTKTSLKMTREQVKQSIVVALLLHVVYIGGIFYGVSLGVSAGISAVIVSLQPVLVALMAVPLLGERLRSIQILGLVLGIVGVALLLLPKVFQGDLSSAFSGAGILACVIALLGTTGGYLAQKKTGGEIPFLPGTAVQFAATAVTFSVLAGLTEDRHVEWNLQFVFALAWIVLALSIASIFVLYYLLRHGSAGSVSSLYYLVPPAAAVQAYFLFDETIPPVGLIGMALAALGVLLVMRESNASH